ncbi:hypothetical protein X943_002285 [Babesia divergens]|uniref:Uncharacterized protein n=1 Tax=Babesia divergens TaxID=32595 RepID=A0AAD9GFI5_BABDI|nr:hypothetical protein X943_002285 [Babesia divergens]
MKAYLVESIVCFITIVVLPHVESYIVTSRRCGASGLYIPNRGTLEPYKRAAFTIFAEEDGECSHSAVLDGPRIDEEGRIINKKKKLYSYGELEHVDDFFVGKYRVEWVVRGIKEKLRFRRRECGSPPLRTSRFIFAGIEGFIIRLWLDGLYESKPGHIALSLIQQEHWTSLNSPICISAGGITRGPFFFRSTPYFEAIRSFCPLDEAVENNTLRIKISLASR